MRTLINIGMAVGILLLGANIAGFFVELRAPGVDGYIDIAGPTNPYRFTQAQLDSLDQGSFDTKALTEITKLFNDGMAHIDPVDIQQFGVQRFNGTVPITENYILYFLSFVKPDTYLDYEFCSYRRALERGTGRCGQQSLALVDYLNRRGVETGFVHVGDLHTLVTAKSADQGWILLDPDFGAMVPASAKEVADNPGLVLEHYWYANVTTRNLHNAYKHLVITEELGGTEARWHRACAIEKLAYLLKWGIPFLLLLLYFVFVIWSRRSAGPEQGD